MEMVIFARIDVWERELVKIMKTIIISEKQIDWRMIFVLSEKLKILGSKLMINI
jgi:hypothetical protein